MESISRFSSRPDVFSRRALELTFQLLRNNDSGLALDIQNQLQGTKVPELADQAIQMRDARDHFRITLTAHTIGKIVAALNSMKVASRQNTTREMGQLAPLRALIEAWMALAEWHVARAGSPSDTYC